MSILKGYKTYIVAAIGLLYGLVHADPRIIMESLMAMTIRHAIN